MELLKAHKIATELIIEHCPDYSFKFDNAKQRFGRCDYGKKIISISKYLTFLNDELKVVNTIKHEIAHALTKGSGHNRIWRVKALSLGCDGNRCYDSKDVEIIKGRFVYKCPACKKRIYGYRKMKKRKACSDCCRKYNNNKFSSDYEFVYLGGREENEF